MTRLSGITGIILSIETFDTNNVSENGCYQLLTLLQSDEQTVQFIIAPDTYLTNHLALRTGATATCYYDINAPVPLIYPPRYRAIVITTPSPYENIYVNYFNNELISADNMLKLNPISRTNILLTNGMIFHGPISNHNLIVYYGPATRSIPAITTPTKIIVLCL